MTNRHNSGTTAPFRHNLDATQVVESAGEPCRIRTCDQLIKSPAYHQAFPSANSGMDDLVVPGTFKAVRIGSHQNMADWGGVRERCLSSGLPGASGATGRTRFQQVTMAGATAF
jgi:hypothetical protein